MQGKLKPFQAFRRRYTKADLDRCKIGDAQRFAGYVRSLGYCVEASDIDFPGDLDCVINLSLMEDEKAKLDRELKGLRFVYVGSYAPFGTLHFAVTPQTKERWVMKKFRLQDSDARKENLRFL